MSSSIDTLAKDLKKILDGTDSKNPKPYDTPATVVKDDGDGTIWVHIPGGAESTPVKKTINAVEGDVVQVRVSGGQAWITGNATAPPTDDKTAIEARLKSIEANILAQRAYESANDAVYKAEESAATMASAVVAINSDIENLQDQIDGNITTWYYSYAPTLSNAPASNWTTTDEKNNHIGDLFYNSSTGYAYRFMLNGSSYEWVRISDEDISTALANAAAAQDTADHKRRVFINTPTVPYDVGDLWCVGSSGDILTCTTAKTAQQSYSASDWSKLNKYTDDSALTTFLSDTYSTDKTNLQNQIDGKAETWYQSSDPSTAWTTSALKSAHEGDLWYKTTDGTTWYWNGSSWQQQNVPTAVFDKIDGKAQIFTSQPTTPYNVGDLWFNSTTSDIMTCINARATGNYTASDWQKRNKYTDDSRANAAYTLADEAKTSANGKNTIYYNTSTPTGGTYKTGDTWFKMGTYNGNTVCIGMYKWSGSAWVLQPLADGAFANLDVGKLTGDYIDASHIDASTLTIGGSGLATTANVSDAVDGINVGGRNLLRGTASIIIGSGTSEGSWANAKFYKSGPTDGTVASISYSNPLNLPTVIKATFGSTTNANLGFAQAAVPIAKETVTLSAWVKGTAGDTVRIQPCYVESDNSGGKPESGYKDFTIADSNWHRYEYSKTLAYDHLDGSVRAGFVYGRSATAGRVFYICGVKLEYGNKATDWTPAPEDTSAQEQIIYKQAVSGTNTMSGTTTWVTATSESVTTGTPPNSATGLTPIWTTKRPSYQKNYPVLFVATQRKSAAGEVTCTTPLKDDTTTIIDGGHITTGTIDANRISSTVVNAINANVSDTINGNKINASEINIGSLAGNIGGRNLLKINGSSTSKNTYRFADIPLTEPLVAGVTYTLQLWGVSLDANSTGIGAYWGSGNNNLCTFARQNGHLTNTFTVTSAQASHADASNLTIYLYSYPSGRSDYNTSITKWKLEKGNKATDWSPAPEDIVNNNLLIDSQKMGSWQIGANASLDSSGEFGVATITGDTNWTGVIYSKPTISTSILDGSPLWLSFEYQYSEATAIAATLAGTAAAVDSTTSITRTKYLSKWPVLKSTNTWTKYSIQMPSTVAELTSGSGDVNSLYVQFYNYYTAGSTLKIRKVKLEHGIGSTDWTPSPQDQKAYITRINDAGIRIHPADTINNSVVINASGMEVFKGGIGSANSVAFYGNTTRIGKTSDYNIQIGQNEFKFVNNGTNLTTIKAEVEQGASGDYINTALTVPNIFSIKLPKTGTSSSAQAYRVRNWEYNREENFGHYWFTDDTNSGVLKLYNLDASGYGMALQLMAPSNSNTKQAIIEVISGSIYVWFGVGNGGENHGIYSETTGGWMICHDNGDYVRIPQVYSKTSSNSANVYVATASDTRGRLYRSTASSRRYKKNIEDIEGADALYDVKVRQFKYREDYLDKDDQRYDKTVSGFIAEELDEVYPIAVEYSDGRAEDWNARYIIPPMLKLIQDQKKKIDELEQRLEVLERRINE